VIGRISGRLIDKRTPEILVEAQGVGYEVSATTSLWASLPATGDEVSFCTHFVVREDAQLLFGFIDTEERLVFRELIRVGGIGPKVAMGILSGMPAMDLMQTLMREDVTALTRIPGVGRKTAERLVVELRDRLEKLDLGVAEKGREHLANANGNLTDPLREAESALVALGYKPQEAAKMLAGQDFSSNPDVADQVRQALRKVMQK